ncbi:MAG: phosphoglycerate mutase family protein [Chloroflexota bacterium]|nr:phosphoglycerate mutase family protein [Chloroflexota bacterium]
MPGRLILVKHSHVDIVPGRPPRRWELSAIGRLRALTLADRLAGFGASRVVSSVEPKAVETAEIVAQRLRVPAITVPGLHEHERESAPFLGAEAFAAAIAWLFEEPDRVVFGEESADSAADRFAAAIDGLSRDHDEILVAHGTVIALYVSRLTGIDPYPLWQSLGLPSYVVLSRGARPQVEIVTAVA